jgi:hypothetical protein
MCDLKAGDLVRALDREHEMLAIGRADDGDWAPDDVPALFCVWEEGHLLREEVFAAASLVLIRRERRRVPRGGELHFPCRL